MILRGKKYLWVLVFCLHVSGCSYHSAPPDNVDFLPVENLIEFEGVYLNLGEGGSQGKPVYLSSLIWNSRDLDHSTFTAVEVQVADTDTLAVRALRDDQIVKEETFVREKDFRIHQGKIQLHRRWALFNYGGDDVLVGPRYEIYELGLDENRDVKYRSRSAGAGLIFLLFPVAISDTHEVRFLRLTP